MTPDEIKRLFPNASLSTLAANRGESPAAVMERGSSDAPLGKAKAKARDSRKFLVVVTSFRRRLLDQDNLCEKYHVDCCRYAGLLPADSPDHAKIEVGQKKVRSKDEERTEIEITAITIP